MHDIAAWIGRAAMCVGGVAILVLLLWMASEELWNRIKAHYGVQQIIDRIQHFHESDKFYRFSQEEMRNVRLRWMTVGVAHTLCAAYIGWLIWQML